MKTTDKNPPEAKAPAIVKPGEHYCPCNTDLPKDTLTDSKFLFYAAQQSTAMEMVDLINGDKFTDDIKSVFKDRLLNLMSNLTEIEDTAHRAEVKNLMESINSDITFTPEQNKAKERILNLFSIA